VSATPSDLERPKVLGALDRLLSGHAPAQLSDKAFWGAQFDAGLAWVDFPEGFGGLGVAPALQQMVKERLADAGVSSPYGWNPMGIGMAAPTLLAHGSEEHKRELLRPLFTTEEIWCQLFSEPGAGSDLANLSTSAVREGDEWVANGQKVWTSLAHQASWGLLLARTDPGVPKHRGLTYFVVDMKSPGVTVRPLVQMDGGRDFNEVFLENVRIPDASRLGAVGDGWKVALTTLMNERVAIGSQVMMPRGSGHISQLVDLWRRSPGDAVGRRRVVDLWMQAEAVRLTVIRADQKAVAGIPGPEGSIIKLAAAQVEQRLYDTALEILGPEGTLYPTYEPQEELMGAGYYDLRSAFLFSKHVTIAGGTTEVMQNILAERVLGLPPDPRQDNVLPWNETLRG